MAGLVPLLMLAAILFLPFLFALYLFLVNVGADQIAIVERRYIGTRLQPGRVFGLGGEVGIRAKYLQPGLHFIFWPLVRVVSKYNFITIGSDELGIIEATDGESMPSGRIFAEDIAGEHHNNFQDPVAFLTHGGIRGKQLRFLTNGTYKIHPWLFKVTKIKKTVIPEGKIGVVTAADGTHLEAGQLLGRSVEGHDSFQKAEIFLKNGGQKGPQTDFLRPGTYNINTEIFEIKTFDAVKILENQIGIVEARAGLSMEQNEVVADTPEGHKNFQDGQLFLNNKGKRGPQESVLTPGTYYINPFLFSVSTRQQTIVDQGEVAVLISNIGKDPTELPLDALGTNDTEESRLDIGVKTRHVVPKGYRGIQKDVLGPGAYNINTLAYTVVVIPTNTRSINWGADPQQDEHKNNARIPGSDNPPRHKHEQENTTRSMRFDPFQVVSHDGFPMQVEVRCQYRILPENSPYVVQKIGSIADLERNVIHPQIDGIFRAQVARSPAISYQQNRAEEQKSAEEAVRKDLSKYRVEVVSVMITNIHLPEALMKTTQQKNLAEQEKSMYDAKREAEHRRIEFEKTRAEADAQVKIVTAEAGIKVAQHEAKQAEERARGDAARVRMLAEADAAKTQQVGDAEAAIIRSKGEAQAKAYQDQVSALTSQGVTAIEIFKSISSAGLKITPEIQVNGSGQNGEGGLTSVLLGQLMQSTLKANSSANPPAPSA